MSAEEAGVGRGAHYQWLDTDPEYAEQFEIANDELVDDLEQEARRRALDGVEEPVYYRGERVGVVRRYSDALLMLLLKAKRPDQFRDSVDVNNKVDGGVIDVNAMKTLTDEEVKMARIIARKLAGQDG